MAVSTSNKGKDAYLWAGLIAIGAYFITRHEWANLATYLPVTFFFLAWFLLFVVPIRCRYPGRKGPCRNRAYGLIFGCKQFHFWMKARARWGGAEQEGPSHARARRRTAGDTGFETVYTEETSKERRERIGFWLGVVSFILGLATSIGSIANWVATAIKWIVSFFG
jgi:hypothetical protein